MRTTIAISLLVGIAAALAGCGEVNVDVSDFRVPGAAEPAPPPDPSGDPRSGAEIRAENAQLRQNLAQLERTHRDWKAAVDRKEDEVDLLEDQLDALKKQRDRAKDALDD